MRVSVSEQLSVLYHKKYGQHLAESPNAKINGPSLSKFVKFYYRIILLHWILKYIRATILKSLCSMEISILVVVVIWDLIFITLFLATIKFHFHELCFLSRKKFFHQKYSLFSTKFSNTNHFQLPGSIISLTVLHHNILSLKWQLANCIYLVRRGRGGKG